MNKPDYTKEEYTLQKSKENVQHLEQELKNRSEKSKEAIELETKAIEDTIAEYQKKIDQLKNDKYELEDKTKERFGIPVLKDTIHMSENEIREKEIILQQNKWADELEERFAGKEESVYFIYTPRYISDIDPSVETDIQTFIKGKSTQNVSEDVYIVPKLTDLRTKRQNFDVTKIVQKAVGKQDEVIEYSNNSVSEEEKLAFAKEQILRGENIIELSKVVPLEKLDLPVGTIINLGHDYREKYDEHEARWLYKDSDGQFVVIRREGDPYYEKQYGYETYACDKLPDLKGSLEWSIVSSDFDEEKSYNAIDKTDFERLKPIIAAITHTNEDTIYCD